MVALDTIDKGLPEAADDPIAITDRRIKGLLKNNIALENISLIFLFNKNKKKLAMY